MENIDLEYNNYVSNEDLNFSNSEEIIKYIESMGLEGKNNDNLIIDKNAEKKEIVPINPCDNNSNSNIDDFELPIKERIKRRLKYPKAKKRKKDYSSSSDNKSKKNYSYPKKTEKKKKNYKI